MAFTAKEGRVFFHEFSSIASCLTNQTIPIREAPANELGFTTPDNIIYLSLTNKIYDTLSENHGFIFLRGIFSHELLHVLITDFTKYGPAIERYNKQPFEREIYASILNILEDGAIEYFAPEHLSDEYVRSLEFVRAKIYHDNGKLQRNDSPFRQFLSAMLQFRFFGFLRGKISNRKARRIFAACVPLFGRCFEEPRQAKRIEYADRIFELSRPLWERAAQRDKEMQEEIRKMLEELMQDYYSAKNNGSGSGNDTSDPEAGANSPITKRRRITFKRISAEEYERMMEENTPGDGNMPDGDITILVPDGPVKNRKEQDEGKMPAQSKDSPKGQSGNDDANSGENSSGARSNVPESDDTSGDKNSEANPTNESDGNNVGNSKDGEKPNRSNSKPDGQSRPDVAADDSSAQEHSRQQPQTNSQTASQLNDFEAGDHWNTPDVTMSPEEFESAEHDMETELEKEYQLTEEDLMAIQTINQRYEAAKELENKSVSDDETNLDLPVTGGLKDVCKRASCQNLIVKSPDSPSAQKMYADLVSDMSGGITSLANQLSRILKNRQEEKMYKQNGKVSIKRLYCGRVTSRVFTKRRLPDATEMAVAVAVDMSGSMSGAKIAVAQKTAIALAEVFGKLGIPLYLFGFSADMNGFDVSHFHFINWSNKKSDRLRLLGIKACVDNFDGYSIRYATELLRRKDAEKKLLLVISDGNPAAMAYRYANGIQDVQLAVNEANRVATTIGILLGDLNPKYHRQMYGYNFVHCNKVNDLFQQLGKVLKKYI